MRAGTTLYTLSAQNWLAAWGHNKVGEMLKQEQWKMSLNRAFNHSKRCMLWITRRVSLCCTVYSWERRGGMWFFFFEFEHTRWACRHFLYLMWRKKILRGLHGGFHAQKVNSTLIRGKDESRRNLENFQYSDPVNENHSPHCETFKSSSIPRWFSPNTELMMGRRQRCVYTELHSAFFGESPDGILVPALSVKGLISCSWFEECNCFYVCTSMCM